MSQQTSKFPPITIPFNRAHIVGKELYYIAQAVLRGELKGDGPFTQLCHRWFEERFGVKKALLTQSCTAALEMAAILFNLSDGDEVVLPSYTFTSTANAFLLRGVKPVFIDIREDTLNMDERQLSSLITNRTKAICAMHYAGVACEMDEIMEVADRHGLLVVEDAAHAILATYKGRSLGTIGHLGTFSFHETKNYNSGEGGALLINSTEFAKRAEIIREKGTNRSQFFRGEVDKYTWVDIGSSYLPSEIIAAFLYGQLEHADEINAERLEIWGRYFAALRPLEDLGLLRLPVVPSYCEHNAHMFYVLLDSVESRDRLIHHMRSLGVGAVFHYVPLHDSPMGERLGYRRGMLPVTENLSERIVRLPLYSGLTEVDQQKVCNGVKRFFGIGAEQDARLISNF